MARVSPHSTPPPFAAPPITGPGNPLVFNVHGSSERVTSQTLLAPKPAPFPQYDLGVPVGPIAPAACHLYTHAIWATDRVSGAT